MSTPFKVNDEVKVKMSCGRKSSDRHGGGWEADEPLARQGTQGKGGGARTIQKPWSDARRGNCLLLFPAEHTGLHEGCLTSDTPHGPFCPTESQHCEMSPGRQTAAF